MANTIHIIYWKSPVGDLVLGDCEGQLCLADWRFRKMRSSIDKRIQDGLQANYVESKTELHTQAIDQLNEYFNGKRSKFDIPLKFVGSDFQKSVWSELMQIPYGETSSYMELSRRLKNEKAIRAVASANGANAISIIIPCHRVIGSDGSLTGYAGGIPVKKRLLKLENPEFDRQMSMFEG